MAYKCQKSLSYSRKLSATQMFTFGGVRVCNPNFELSLLQHSRMPPVTNRFVCKQRNHRPSLQLARFYRRILEIFTWPIRAKNQIDCSRKLIPSNAHSHVRGCVSKIPGHRMHLQNFLPAFVGKLLTMFAQAYRSSRVAIVL